jgi:AcrR family transcriptional regulator
VESSETRQVGLRERKRIKTISTVQSAALKLFLENGYDATTVQQIAAAAEVSESTFFRYFPTKEDVVLQDDLDPIFDEALRAQPADLQPVEAIRRAFGHVFALLSSQERSEQRDRIGLVLAVPELRARALDQFFGGTTLIADALAQRSGRPANDLSVRALAGAVIGASMAILLALTEDSTVDVAELLDATLLQLEKGFTL